MVELTDNINGEANIDITHPYNDRHHVTITTYINICNIGITKDKVLPDPVTYSSLI